MSSTTDTSIADTALSGSSSSTETTTAAIVEVAIPVVLPLLKVEQQIAVPTQFEVDGVAKDLINGSFSTSDPTIAVVSPSGLVTRVSGTTGTEVTITYYAQFIEPGIGSYPVEFSVTYAVYQPDLNKIFTSTLQTVEVAV